MNSYSECLLASMVRDKGITDSINELGDYVRLFLLGEKIHDRNDQFLIDNRSITQMGTGARSLLMIIMALIHPDYTTVLIDEPELFLDHDYRKRYAIYSYKKESKKDSGRNPLAPLP